MSNLLFSANVVLPLLVLMAVGYCARHFGLISLQNASQCNALVFRIFLPTLIFNNVRESTMSNIHAGDVFLFLFCAILVAFTGATILTLLIEKDNKKRGAMIQGMVRSNYALFGIPLIILLFPGQDVALASILIAIVIPVFNIGAVIVLTYFGDQKADFKHVFINILKNPLIWATFFGFVCLFANLHFPAFIEKSLTNLSSIATPFALFLLGARFEFKGAGKYVRQLTAVVFTRLIILPVLVTTAAALLGFRGVELGCIMVIFASPTGVSSYTMAETMGSDGELAAGIVVFTSALCIFTLFIGIFILKSLQLL